MKTLAVLASLAVLALGCNSGASPVAPAGTEEGVILKIYANPVRIAVGGSSEITVTAVLNSGIPVRTGTVIRLYATLGTIREVNHTDANGVARATLQAGDQTGMATVRAVSGAVGTDSSKEVKVDITIGGAAPEIPVAKFTAAVDGLKVTFTDMSEKNPTSWAWEFGDGDTSDLQNPIHFYEARGVYPVTLTAANAAGSTTTSQSIEVPETEPPEAKFEFREVDGLEVLFRDTSTHDPTSWAWDFGDDSPGSSEQNPRHTYAATGTYTVTLRVENRAGSDVETKFVDVLGPLEAAFSFVVSGRTVSFTDRSAGTPTTFLWSFGDGATSMDRHPVRTYTAAGTYQVTLTVSRTPDSVKEEDTTTRSVTVQ